MNHIVDANKMVGEDHLPDASKMVRDTPRTEAEVNRQKCWSDDLITIDANFACQLERELNAATSEIERLRKANLQLREGAEEQKQRIKRLEDCAETAWGIIANVDSGSWQEQRADWREAATRWRDEQFHPELSERKAKEAKP